MAIIRKNELRKLNKEELIKKLDMLRKEMIKVNSKRYSGQPPENPGKVKEIRRTIARILTILREKGYKE